MDIKERQEILRKKREKEEMERSQLPVETPDQIVERKKKLKEGTLRYNRGTGKMESVD